eukprot:352805-Chlamydomonas_euryale.AAC.6
MKFGAAFLTACSPRCVAGAGYGTPLLAQAFQVTPAPVHSLQVRMHSGVTTSELLCGIKGQGGSPCHPQHGVPAFLACPVIALCMHLVHGCHAVHPLQPSVRPTEVC